MAHVITHHHTYHDEGEHIGSPALVTIANIVWYIFAAAETLLLFRLLLKFLGATASNGLIGFIYNITQPMMAPFAGIFGTIRAARGVVELDTILAALVYWLMATIIVSLLKPRFVADHEHVDTIEGEHYHDHTHRYDRGYAD